MKKRCCHWQVTKMKPGTFALLNRIIHILETFIFWKMTSVARFSLKSSPAKPVFPSMNSMLFNWKMWSTGLISKEISAPHDSIRKSNVQTLLHFKRILLVCQASPSQAKPRGGGGGGRWGSQLTGDQQGEIIHPIGKNENITIVESWKIMKKR